MGEDVTTKECFRFGEETRERLDKFEANQKESHDALTENIEGIKEKLMNRLPLWATFVMSFLTMLVGALLTKVVFK